MITFACRKDNDLYKVLTSSGYDATRSDSLAEALDATSHGSAVLALADDYPRPCEKVDQHLLDIATAKGLRLYIEYPAALPGKVQMAVEPRQAEWERLVVSSDFFAPALEKYAILAMHSCWFLPIKVESPHLVVARVAGYHKAVYGLPDETFPILFQLPGHDVLIATSKLSQFVTGRYAPSVDWKALWVQLLKWLLRSDKVLTLNWTPTVGLQAMRESQLPEAAEAQAFQRSVRWFRENIVFSIDWKKGATEGFESAIDYEGRQMRRTIVRGDCTAETAMVFAYDWATNHNPASRRLAGQILDYVWSTLDFRQADPNTPVYGLNNWYERGPVFYGDDNARVMLPTLAAGRLLDDDRWDEHVLRCLLANLRTTGPLGFRFARLDYPASFPDGRGWEYYRDTEVIDYAPHYQAYLWASFLWTYALTGYEGFLTKTKNAIRMIMDVYPKWRWTNGFTQELARMLLPLAFLVRIEDTAEHHEWIMRIAYDLLTQMQPCGAIREKIGPLEDGDYPPPQSNERYGTSEASLLQENGDPVSDLLYTVNYAFLGLHEAAAATRDSRLQKAEDSLADFLCRIQVRSSVHPYLDGAWLRGFDDELWEYWGSSSDLGWGAWSAESGWTNTWIASVLAMRGLGETLFNLATSQRLKSHLPTLVEEML